MIFSGTPENFLVADVALKEWLVYFTHQLQTLNTVLKQYSSKCLHQDVEWCTIAWLHLGFVPMDAYKRTVTEV